MTRLGAVLVAVGALLGALACGKKSDDTDGGEIGDTFVVYASNFTGYHDWQAFHVADGGAVDDAGIHLSGPRTEYLKFAGNTPAHGDTEFPVGTLIVKEFETGELGSRQIFAMVKRGGDFNPPSATDPGCLNWEWFELGNLTDGSGGVNIIWRGVGPPVGEQYGGDPNAGCNACHSVAATTNDHVQSPNILLSNF